MDSYFKDLSEELDDHQTNRQKNSAPRQAGKGKLEPLSSWHETSRNFGDSQPKIPSSGNSIVLEESQEKSKENKKNDCKKPSSTQKLRAKISESSKFVKQDMITICNKGWNLSQGWQNRPKAVQINKELVEYNIQKWADRVRKPRDTVENCDELGAVDACDIRFEDTLAVEGEGEPSISESGPSKKFNMNTTLLNFYAVNAAGPQINLRPSTSEGSKATTGGNQTFNSTAKEINFGMPQSDRYSYQGKSYSPGPVYAPQTRTVAEGDVVCTRMSSSGRTLNGSIYQGLLYSYAPGPGRYSPQDCYPHVAGVVPTSAPKLPPKVSMYR